MLGYCLSLRRVPSVSPLTGAVHLQYYFSKTCCEETEALASIGDGDFLKQYIIVLYYFVSRFFHRAERLYKLIAIPTKHWL